MSLMVSHFTATKILSRLHKVSGPSHFSLLPKACFDMSPFKLPQDANFSLKLLDFKLPLPIYPSMALGVCALQVVDVEAHSHCGALRKGRLHGTPANTQAPQGAPLSHPILLLRHRIQARRLVTGSTWPSTMVWWGPLNLESLCNEGLLDDEVS